MIQSEKIEFIAIVVIATLVLVAVVPLGSAVVAPPIFEDDFESGNLDKWSVTGNVDVTNDSTYAPPWGGYYARFSGNASINMQGILSAIDTTCMKKISVSFALRTVNLTSGDNEKFAVQFNDGSGWKPAPQYSDNLSWFKGTLLLPVTADDNPNLKIRFVLGNADPGEYAFLDNVTVTGEPMFPALEVNKTVYDPKNETWVKELTAKINDTLQFTSTITNTGNINLTQIRFWDIMDCSLEYQKFSLKINGTTVYIYDSPWFRFKPHVLHPDDCGDWISDPMWKNFTELYPPWGYRRQIVGWNDTNYDGNVSACDQVQLESCVELEPTPPPTDGFIAGPEGPLQSGDDGGNWYHVDRVPYTLTLYNETEGENKYFDSELNWDHPYIVTLGDPISTTWLCVCCCKDQYEICCKDRYTLIGWDGNVSKGISPGDNVYMRNERTKEVVVYTVEEVAKDLVVSREYEIDDYLYDLTQLEPNQTITIEYNATVVCCGVDNNTFVAKGMGCGDNWTYSDPDVVTITVPCPSGDAADGTPAIKDVFTTGEPVYALAHNFAPNKNVSIYITPVRQWSNGDNINDYKIVGPVNVTTDANGSIGINPKVLMWPDPVPGQYHMVFDDPDGRYEPGVDLYDFFEVRGIAVPVVTPLGIVALIGLLSVVATRTLLARKKR